MIGYIISAIIGAICILCGSFNMAGILDTLHTYHYHRVSSADVLPFGRLIGLGTIIIGAGIIAFSALSIIADRTGNQTLTLIGVAVMFVGIIVGLIMSISAMIKYNGGIF